MAFVSYYNILGKKRIGKLVFWLNDAEKQIDSNKHFRLKRIAAAQIQKWQYVFGPQNSGWVFL
jgi:hypothetical protein